MKGRIGWMERAGWMTVGLIVGAALSAGAASPNVDTLYRKLEVLAEIFSEIENHYVESVSASDIVYGAARGATRTLDAHSAFFTPEEYRDLINITEGEYAGIGVEISADDGPPEVITVFENSPAHKAGIQSRDLIIAIDGEPTEDLGVDAVKTKLRGPVGSKVVLSIRREGREELWGFTLVRGWIRVAPLQYEPLGDGIQYAHVKSFAKRVALELESALNRNQPERGLILDLRGNPGGLFDEAVALSDLFIAEGPLVSVVGKGGRVLERHVAHKRNTQPSYPLAILVDRDSASAAEVVAGALRDRHRARLFGERTYGKGSVQTIRDLSDGAGLKLTVARYRTPSGVQIDGKGIEPDVPVELTDESKDEPLIAARDWIMQSNK